MTMPANSIETATKMVGVLDKIYKAGAKFANLDPAPNAIKPTDQAGTFKIRKLTLTGLGNYSKTTGFPKGKVAVEWELFTYSQDRGRSFSIDAVDETEAMGVFGEVGAEFMRVHEIPEVDAYRAAKLVEAFGIDASATLDTTKKVIDALNVAYETLVANNVDLSRLVLYITPTLPHRVRTSVATTDGVTDIFELAEVVEVPNDRFYTAITLDDGSAEDEGGYAKAVGAADINFILMDKGAAFSDAKHQVMRIWSPRGENGYPMNPDGDAWKYEFRLVHECFVYANRLIGGYVHTKTAPTGS